MRPLSSHLQVMGIQQWVLRAAPSGVPEEREGDFSLQIARQGEVAAPLLIITTALDAPAESLLEAMLWAIGVQRADCYQITVLDEALFTLEGFHHFIQQQVAESAADAMLQLGGAPLPISGLITTHHPRHLLRHPEDKRIAWEALKQLRRQL
ncbi:MAG: hypothetical protein HN842_07315 [Gammaproteobacteria bacterium]|jgi:DNA polymerase III psi subunit|nr:hypothetical protein [Gammaproteobacteria bacterium]MBT7308009.1 hypothetical protein [Gammaproteobacteria bacterium]